MGSRELGNLTPMPPKAFHVPRIKKDPLHFLCHRGGEERVIKVILSWGILDRF
jgi:hypothetical protein